MLPLMISAAALFSEIEADPETDVGRFWEVRWDAEDDAIWIDPVSVSIGMVSDLLHES